MSISTVVNNAMFKWFWMNYILVGCPWYAVPVSIIARLFLEILGYPGISTFQQIFFKQKISSVDGILLVLLLMVQGSDSFISQTSEIISTVIFSSFE